MCGIAELKFAIARTERPGWYFGFFPIYNVVNRSMHCPVITSGASQSR